MILLVLEVLVSLGDGVDEQIARMISKMQRLCDTEQSYGEIGMVEVSSDGDRIG